MKRLFILSVDSLFYDDMAWLQDCPYLSDVLRRGSQVKQVQTVYPAMTYAAHATMLTGCYPATHGIYHNEKVQIGVAHPEWHWRRAELKVPTIMDAAAPEGYRFCVVNWPVTGADPNIAYNIPEIWSDDPAGDSRPRFVSVCSPEIVPLFDKYRHLLRWKEQPELDEFGVCCLTEVIERHQPEVIMLHLSFLDHARHRHGAFSSEAKEALRACDERFGRIVEQLKRWGLWEQTNVVVLGDHGHLQIKRVFNPNILLREKGLIQTDEKGQVTSWKAYCHSAGLSCHVVLADPTDNETRKVLEETMAEMVADQSLGCEQVIGKKELLEVWHLSGPFDYAIEGDGNTAFGNMCVGKLFISPDNSDYKFAGSAHGHLPTKGPQPTFFLAGPDIKPGMVEEHGRMIDMAPTWAAILGVKMPKAEGKVLTQFLNESFPAGNSKNKKERKS